MKKILFPTDFSPAAANAFRYAHALAELLEARIDLINVFHLPIGDASNIPPEYIQKMLDEAEVDTQEKLKEFAQPCLGKPTCGELQPIYGLFTAVEITDVARQNNYDLIVMGTKGERGALEKFLGSVTTDVMMKASCPVLAIPAEAEFHPIAHIAYATAFEPSDEHAVGNLMELAGLLAAQVHFVNVNTQSGKHYIQDVEMEKDYPYNFTDFSVVHHSSIQDGLDEYLNERKIDWLALFIPHRRLWERLFHSSFTKRMTFHTQVPLLIFHANP
ncbi:MAG: universal stress protein [Lewinellaceae bacterium]|nr:universal stress protein [Lewinellaceae bacterium]